MLYIVEHNLCFTMMIKLMKSSNWLKGFVVTILICAAAYAGFVFGKKHEHNAWKTANFHSETSMHATRLKSLMLVHGLLEAEQTLFVKSLLIEDINTSIFIIELFKKTNTDNQTKSDIDQILKEAKLYVQRYPEQGAKAILEAKPD